MKILTLGNPKTTKSLEFGYLTGILHLLPHSLSGHNVCPKASDGCKAACLNLSGRGGMSIAQKARLRRTKLYFDNRQNFEVPLMSDIITLIDLAQQQNLKPAVRINGTSDLPALAIRMAGMFPEVQFYDYTKIKQTMLRNDLPANYHLTFSRSESNGDDVVEVLAAGRNVSVVFSQLPKYWMGTEVIDGDKHDLRFLDPSGVIVGLTPKGTLGKKDQTGFVVRTF